jgi:hypothetical protein
MRDLLFSVPWWLPTIIAIAGLALFVSGNRRQHDGLRKAGAGVMLFALAWAVVSYLVETPKEICQKQTRQFVQSVVDRNWKQFDGLMDPNVGFRFEGSSWQIDGRETLSSAVKADVEQIGLKSATITDMKAGENGDTVAVTIKLWSNQDFTMERPLDSEWEFDWTKSDGRWLLHQVRALRISGLEPQQIRGTLKVH